MAVVRQHESVAIIGGGIVGLSLAWRLAQTGFSVTVYEKSALGSEASWAGAGMLAPGGEFETASELARLALQSRDIYPAFVAELQRDSGLAIDLQQTGALDVAYSAVELAELEQRAGQQTLAGILSKRLRPEQISTFWPRLRKEHLAGGYFYPADAFVDPRQVVAALRVCAQARGVTMTENTAVTSMDIANESVRINDTIKHDAAVVASGAWSGALMVNGAPALPHSEPVRGHLVGYHQPEQICNTIIRHGRTYLLQRAKGFLIVGASMERAGFDRTLDSQAAEQLTQAAAFLMPHLSETSPSEVWNGFRPFSDGLQIGAWHSPRLYLAYGHFRNGILLAPLTAKLLANEISSNLRRS